MGPLQGTHVLDDGRISEIPVLCDADGRVLTVAPDQVPRDSVTPGVGGIPTRKALKTTNAAGSASKIIGWRISITPGDDVVAGGRLAEHGEDTTFLPVNADLSLTVEKDEAYSVYVVCVANVAYAANTILPTGTSEADTRAAMQKFDFDANTKTLEFSVSDNFELDPGGTPKLNSMITVEGRSHA